jgi:hypothetical protein
VGVIARTYGLCVRHWTHEEATAALPGVSEKVLRIRELFEQAKATEARATETTSTNGHGQGPSSNGHGGATRDAVAAEISALIAELQADGIVVRDPERGLIDFPALAPSGETYLLCWLVGEDAIDWWHWPDAGFAGRTPITTPPE